MGRDIFVLVVSFLWKKMVLGYCKFLSLLCLLCLVSCLVIKLLVFKPKGIFQVDNMTSKLLSAKSYMKNDTKINQTDRKLSLGIFVLSVARYCVKWMQAEEIKH